MKNCSWRATAFAMLMSSAMADNGGGSPTFWVYHDGVFAWPGDYSFVAVPDYRDKTGQPLSGNTT